MYFQLTSLHAGVPLLAFFILHFWYVIHVNFLADKHVLPESAAVFATPYHCALQDQLCKANVAGPKWRIVSTVC